MVDELVGLGQHLTHNPFLNTAVLFFLFALRFFVFGQKRLFGDRGAYLNIFEVDFLYFHDHLPLTGLFRIILVNRVAYNCLFRLFDRRLFCLSRCIYISCFCIDLTLLELNWTIPAYEDLLLLSLSRDHSWTMFIRF